MKPNPMLEVKNVKKYFPVKRGLLRSVVGQVKAVDDISFSLHEGETLGLVGESGCGKSTLGRTIVRLYDPTEGEVYFRGDNFANLKGQKLKEARKDIQMIFQDPFASLDPRMTIAQILTEPEKVHGIGTKASRLDKAKSLLEKVGLKSSYINRYPHEFSGGQRQRISIARTIALGPKLVIADEPVSALDVSIQAQVLNLMMDLQEELGLTYLFISHDLSVVEHFCDRIAVMYLGKIVEIGTRDELFKEQKHPYTKALIGAVPQVGKGKKMQKKALDGEVPSPLNPPKGCAFHPRCPVKMDRCSQETPQLKSTDGGKTQVACWKHHS